VAMMVVLLGDADGEFCVREELVLELAKLGVTNVALVRDEQTVGIVLEGWLFDPARSAAAAAAAVGAGSPARTLHPLLQLAVSSTAAQSTDGRE
jgi:hypothetical protein